MSDYVRGEVLSFSRPQITRASILTAAPGGGAPYGIELPINGTPRAFTFAASGGLAAESIAAGLEAVLLAAQTVYAIERSGAVLMIAGPMGTEFTATAVGDVLLELFEEPILAMNAQTGRPLGPCRVIHARNSAGVPPREFWTRDSRTGETLAINMLQVRELGTSYLLDIPADRVQIRLRAAR